jgi:16S rRNA (cytidine1402-2'-O)-methyltransferase
MERKAGVLYVVATPIGNLDDTSARACKVLTDVDFVVCEDTRHSRPLLRRCGVDRPLIALHEHNEDEATPRLLDLLGRGSDLALISDAGTPLISDPGFVLVRAARRQGLTVTPVPGPSAVICALSASGLPSDRFLFLGFPPRSDSARLSWLQAVVTEPGTLICFESGRRAEATLRAMAEVLGPRPAVVARELTKRYETFLAADLPGLAEQVAADAEQQLGELVILVEGDRRSAEERSGAEQQRILRLLAAEMPVKQAVALTTKITGGSRNRLYRLALAERDSDVGD